MKNLVDMHLHTRFSVDSEADECEMTERAVSLGLTAIAVTDHCECNRWFAKEKYGDDPRYPYYNFGDDFRNSVSRISELKPQYEGRIKLLCGVEMGEAPECPDIAEIITTDSRLDFILGSIHMLPDEDDFYFIDFDTYTLDGKYRLLGRYFEEVLKLCRMNNFDILSHLTYPMRYMQGHRGETIDIFRFRDIIAEIFRTVITNGKGIEINTSGLRKPYGLTSPEPELVKFYRELGGEILTLGSDSHTVAELGAGIQSAAEFARECGFGHISYYEKHNPVFLPLE